jgi:hypothetical protein
MVLTAKYKSYHAKEVVVHFVWASVLSESGRWHLENRKKNEKEVS